MPPSTHGEARRKVSRVALSLSLALASLASAAAPAFAQSAFSQGPTDERARPTPAVGYLSQPPPPAIAPQPYVAPPGQWAPGSDNTPPAKKEPSATDSMAFDASLVTELPIMMGAQATLELPYRFLLQGEVGVLPSFFVNAVDGALTSARAYDQNTSDLIRAGLKNSLIVRMSGGWRPFTDHGFEILGGYTLTSLGAGVSARQAIEAASGASLPAAIPDGDIILHTTIHSFHVSLGWRWVVADHFVIRANLGYMQAVSSSSHLEVPAEVSANPTTAPFVAQANSAVDTYLDEKLKTYVKLPVLGLSLGYRF